MQKYFLRLLVCDLIWISERIVEQCCSLKLARTYLTHNLGTSQRVK